MIKPKKPLKDISFKDIKNYFLKNRFKIKKNIKVYNDLPKRMFLEMKPVFVVSTGRSGTKLLTKLLNMSKIGNVFHELKPNMIFSSKLAYEMNLNINSKKIAYLSARYDALKQSFLEDKRFVETNNRNSFFISALYSLFPNAKFIHLIRHPGDFVRSGLNRNYYNGNENDDGRITPRKNDKIFNIWNDLDDLEKIAWLWNTTNTFIKSESKNIDFENFLSIRSEDLFSDVKIYNRICSFLNCPPMSEKKIFNIIKKPINKQKQSRYSKWSDWSNEEKSVLMKLTPLGKVYGYWE